jgi:hypothetical protein
MFSKKRVWLWDDDTLLSCADTATLLKSILPRLDATKEEILKQLAS